MPESFTCGYMTVGRTHIKAISRILQSNFRNNLTFLKYSLTQHIKILRIWFVDVFLKVNNAIVQLEFRLFNRAESNNPV